MGVFSSPDLVSAGTAFIGSNPSAESQSEMRF